MKKYKELLIKNNIPVTEVKDIIKGCDGVILHVLVGQEEVFFKFLPKVFTTRLEKEVQVVTVLKNNNCKVPDYYSSNNKIIFASEEEVFYGSLKVPGLPSTTSINKDILKEVMKEIARMHKVLKRVPVEGKIESDIDRFKKFYERNKEFFKEQKLDSYIETILNRTYDKEEYTYIHADINFKNIFVDNNHLSSFIDFTDLRVGYKEDDLGKLFQNILYLDIDDKFLEELINTYESELGEKINKKNLLVSIVFRLLYRYYCFVKNN